jgi:exocyst complex component 4
MVVLKHLTLGLIDDVAVHFRELLSDDANTLETALALMDTSSIGKARHYNEFESLKRSLQAALKIHVNANYQGFNSSIGSYRTVGQCISNTQDNINSARDLVIKAKSDLATRRPILKELRANSLKYKQMIELLDIIEEIKSVQDTLEQQIARKLFLSAHKTVSKAIRKLENEHLNQVSGLDPLRAYLSSQESSLYSILIEELSNHLYLKSPYCDSRWSAYSQGRDEVSSMEQLIEDKVRFDMSEESWASSGSAVLDNFLTNFDRLQPLVEDGAQVNEEDSFNYIRLLVEALGRLNRLPNAFDVLQRRLSVELNKLIDKTVSEVSQRSPKQALLSGQETEHPLNLFRDYDSADSNVKLSILKDLAWTLHSKLIAVLQGHRVVYEVVQAISSRQGHGTQEKDLEYDFNGVYKTIESQIRQMMQSYVAGKKSDSPAQPKNVGVLQRATTTFRPQPPTKLAFKFNATDSANDELRRQFQILKKKLEDTVPGLASDTARQDIRSPYARTDLTAIHCLLIAPSVLNMRALLEPTVVFLQRAKAVFPTDEKRLLKSSDLFIEEFLNGVFLPELQSSSRNSFAEIMTSIDAFEVDPHWQQLSKRPILQSASAFINLFQVACKVLNTGFLYREKYAMLIISTIRWLNELYRVRYNELVDAQSDDSSSTPPKKLVYVLAVDDTLRRLASKILHGVPQSGEVIDSVDEETRIYVLKRYKPKDQGKEISQSDLLDIDTYRTLSLMSTSLRWIALKLKKMRQVREPDKDGADSPESPTLKSKMKKRWTLLEANHVHKAHVGLDESEYLILAGRTVEEFDNEVSELLQLADLAVMTLRCDIRCRCVYFVDRTMVEGNYDLEVEREERDSFIGILVDSLLSCDEGMGRNLVPRDRTFVFHGLSKLVDQLLIHGADNLKLINSNGVIKMHCNILVLQQKLKSIVSNPQDVDFSRSVAFYDELSVTPTALVEALRNNGLIFKYEECKTLIRLIYNEIIHKHELAQRREAAQAARTAQNQHLVTVHDHFWGTDQVVAGNADGR